MNRQRRKEWSIYRRRNVLKKKRAARNRFLNALPESERISKTGRLDTTAGNFVTLPVPFSFTTDESLDEVLAFISILKNTGIQTRRRIHVDFKNVLELNAGALSLLLSVVQDLQDLKIQIHGNVPKALAPRKAFINSGFLEYVYNDRGIKMPSKNKIIVKGKHKVDQLSTGQEIRKAMKTVFGFEEHNTAMQGALIEMMANSLNHAFPENVDDGSNFYERVLKNKRWYFSAYHLEAAREVHFSFIDNGVGILSTIRRGTFKAMVESLTDAAVLKNAFEGDYRSSTRLRERGKGLPTVKRAHDRQAVSGMKVVTNNQVYDFENQSCTKLTEKFEGTCYFWKVDKTCRNEKIKNQ